MARICNICGKVFDDYDEQENRSFHDYIGYGSKFDLERLDLDMCCNCFDEMLESYILPKCKYSPFMRTDGEHKKFVENESECSEQCEDCKEDCDTCDCGFCDNKDEMYTVSFKVKGCSDNIDKSRLDKRIKRIEDAENGFVNVVIELTEPELSLFEDIMFFPF